MKQLLTVVLKVLNNIVLLNTGVTSAFFCCVLFKSFRRHGANVQVAEICTFAATFYYC
jgi:hypothetical protein